MRNLGYSASATLDLPVWDWLSTQHRVRQSEILRDAAHTALTATQRRLVAQLDESYCRSGHSRATNSSPSIKAFKPQPKACVSLGSLYRGRSDSA